MEYLRKELALRALVTGSTGFIGANIVRELLAAGFEVHVLIRKDSNTFNIDGLPVKIFYGDILDYDSIKEASKKCDALFHAAASYNFWCRDPKKTYEINVQGTLNAIHASLESGVSKIVYTSSESTLKIEKGHIGNESRLNSLDDVAGDYKKSKLMAEFEVEKLYQKGYPIVTVNPTAPIGPWDVKPTPTGRIVVDFLNKRMPAYVNTGMNVIDVRDLAKGHLLAYEKGAIGQRYVLGNKNVTLKEIFEIIGGISRIKPPTRSIPIGLAYSFSVFDEFVSGKVLKKCPRVPKAAVETAKKFRYFDCRKAIDDLGLPQSPIEDAFCRSIKWFKENNYVNN
jgi:dihydroflavonol-4-reductase